MIKPAPRHKSFQAACFTAAFYLALAVLFFLINVDDYFHNAKKNRLIPQKAQSKPLFVRLQTNPAVRRSTASVSNPAITQQQKVASETSTDFSNQHINNTSETQQNIHNPRTNSLAESVKTQIPSDRENTQNPNIENNHDTSLAADKVYNGQNTEFLLTRAAYEDELDKKIKEQLHYPERARKRNMEGAVSITFTIDTGGNLKEYFIDSSSNYPLLDKAASELIEAVFPLQTKPKTTTVSSVKIKYALTDVN